MSWGGSHETSSHMEHGPSHMTACFSGGARYHSTRYGYVPLLLVWGMGMKLYLTGRQMQ